MRRPANSNPKPDPNTRYKSKCDSHKHGMLILLFSGLFPLFQILFVLSSPFQVTWTWFIFLYFLLHYLFPGEKSAKVTANLKHLQFNTNLSGIHRHISHEGMFIFNLWLQPPLSFLRMNLHSLTNNRDPSFVISQKIIQTWNYSELILVGKFIWKVLVNISFQKKF